MRGVTVVDKINEHPALISTRTPHAGSDGAIEPRQCDKVISTRTPHAGSDRYGKFRYLYVKEFQPALPMRGVTPPICKTLQSRRFQPALPMRGVTLLVETRVRDDLISTRTPHAGSDRARAYVPAGEAHFNPHSPCGE